MIQEMSAALVLHEILCAFLFYLAFCRALHAGRQTTFCRHAVIRIIGAVSCLGMVAPLAWSYQPDWFTVVLLCLVVLEVIATNVLQNQRRCRDELV